jgi:hypothetical protein
LAVWSDAFQHSVGNPLLVEIKVRIPLAREISRTLFRFSRSIAAAGSRYGLLLYGHGPNSERLEQIVESGVLTLSIEQLFIRLRTETFSTIVNELRNRQAHGASGSWPQ